MKSRFNVDARAPSIPQLNFPFKQCLKFKKALDPVVLVMPDIPKTRHLKLFTSNNLHTIAGMLGE